MSYPHLLSSAVFMWYVDLDSFEATDLFSPRCPGFVREAGRLRPLLSRTAHHSRGDAPALVLRSGLLSYYEQLSAEYSLM